MSSRLDHGYSVKRTNEVLRGVSIYSGEDRSQSLSDYHRVRVGMKVGSNVEWLATWNQSTQGMVAGRPLSILPASRSGMRLPTNAVIVVELTTVGFPAPMRGSSVDLDLTLTGGSTGERRALVSGGAGGVALQGLYDAVNASGMAEKVARIPLDDVRPMAVASFQGRLQRDSATQASIQRYGGNWIDVDGTQVAIGSSGLIFSNSDSLLGPSGVLLATAPSSSTLYYVYVSTTGDVRLSATAPSLYGGVYYFGVSGAAVRWRFVGWVRLDGSAQFVDTTTDRLVVNYYNREWKSLLLTPGYTDDNAATTYTTTSTTWTAANGGTGATASYIANGEDAIHVTAFGTLSNSNAGVTTRLGIGDNSGANCAAATQMIGTVASPCACSYSTVPATGYRTLVLLVAVSANTGTYLADEARNGSATDPVMTGLYAKVAA